MPTTQAIPTVNIDPKQVTIVCDLLSTFARFRLPVAREMIRRGHVVTVICSRGSTEVASLISAEGVSVEVVCMDRTGLNPIADGLYYLRLRKRLKTLAPDVLLTYQAKAAVYASLAAASVRKCRRHVLFPGLGFLFSDSVSLKKRCLRRLVVYLYRLAFSKIDTAFFQNQEDRQTLETYRIFSRKVNRVLVNGSGVPLDEYAFSELVEGRVRFLMATRLLRTKGVHEFAQAARELKSRYGEAVDFVLLGPIDTNPNALSPALVDEWNAAGFLTYSGAVGDVRPFLADASVFVLPSFYMEGTPRSILEAMAVGRAIITTDHRGCRNTVAEGVNGFLVKPQSVDSLKDAMIKFIENPELIQSMGVASRKMVEEKFDVRDVVKQMCDAMNL